MVSDSDLVGRLREILRDSDLDQATAGSVRRQLEEDLGVDLTDRKAFIREQIDVYLENLGEAGDADDEDGNVKAEDEQPDAAEEEEEQSDGKGSKKRRLNALLLEQDTFLVSIECFMRKASVCSN